MIDAQAIARERMDALLVGGPGWHCYAIDAAEQLEQSDPDSHRGIVAAVESQIGSEATEAARRALAWFRGRGRG